MRSGDEVAFTTSDKVHLFQRDMTIIEGAIAWCGKKGVTDTVRESALRCRRCVAARNALDVGVQQLLVPVEARPKKNLRARRAR